jgi:hypothetical protein
MIACFELQNIWSEFEATGIQTLTFFLEVELPSYALYFTLSQGLNFCSIGPISILLQP